MSEAPQSRKQKESDRKLKAVIREILSWIEVFALAALFAFVLTRFVIANSVVPTGSMENTIMEGDRVIGSRLSYLTSDPERGDVAIFKFGWVCERCGAQGQGEFPESCPACGREKRKLKDLYYVKRVIGLPGDTIEIRGIGSVAQGEMGDLAGLDTSRGDDALLVTAGVFVNGELLDEDYLKEPMLYTGDMDFTVPEGCCFFLGDNRNNSLDARYWADPYIEKSDIIAKVLFRYWPGIEMID